MTQLFKDQLRIIFCGGSVAVVRAPAWLCWLICTLCGSCTSVPVRGVYSCHSPQFCSCAVTPGWQRAIQPQPGVMVSVPTAPKQLWSKSLHFLIRRWAGICEPWPGSGAGQGLLCLTAGARLCGLSCALCAFTERGYLADRNDLQLRPFFVVNIGLPIMGWA